MTTPTTTQSPATVPEALRLALRRAYNYGQTYWQQADSESFNQQRKSRDTAEKFERFVEETIAALSAAAPAAPQAEQPGAARQPTKTEHLALTAAARRGTTLVARGTPAAPMSAQPSDAEIKELAYQHLQAHARTEGGVWYEGEVAFARAVLARWGAPAPTTEQAGEPFQQRVRPWMLACFGEAIAADREERNHRFLEEALELVQATGCTAGEAHQLVDYVFGRPVGEPAQEVGGVMVTLAALCLAQGLDMHNAGEVELARIWTKVDAIRAKQAAKPKHSPLPAAPGGEAPEKGVLAHLDALQDGAAAHIFPSDLERCMTTECCVEVASVRMGRPGERSVPLFSRQQVVDALAAQGQKGAA